MFKHILVPVDGSEHAQRALAVAGDLAQSTGAKVTALHIVAQAGGFGVPAAVKAYAQIEHIRVTERDLIEAVGNELLAAAEAALRGAGATDCQGVLDTGDPAERIVGFAGAEGVDLIVMGRRGLSDLKGLLLGSVSHKVAQAADCSVLTVK